jgi:murein DD-endopeptidase MepM/ murein hydrolase activator NlpD
MKMKVVRIMSKLSEDKLKKILKPLFIAFILFVFIFISAGKNKKEASFLDLDLKENVSQESIFASAVKKSGSELPEFILFQDNTLSCNQPPICITPKVLGALVEGFSPESEKKTITEYAVEQGDNLWSIAAKFDVSLNTILWANDLTKSSLLKIGQKLVIPPVTGVIHHVKDGDTVGGIAKTYDVGSEEIVAFNSLSGEADIYIGDILIVPNGEMPAKATVSSGGQASTWVPVAKSYFICPISLPCKITQGLHWYNAIDFSHGKCGEPIYAAAGGRVIKVKLTNSTSQWAFNGAGNHITILHPNGVVTMYGHISASFVSPGDQVLRGEIIALMGGQPGTPGAGLSTGCHLHFGVTGASNPFAY